MLAEQPRAGERELALRRARVEQVALDAAVPPLELVEHVEHRLGGRGREPAAQSPFRVVARLGQPLVEERREVGRALRVVGRDPLAGTPARPSKSAQTTPVRSLPTAQCTSTPPLLADPTAATAAAMPGPNHSSRSAYSRAM